MNNKKDIYRSFGIWTTLILFYIVFYYLSNYAWVEKVDVLSDSSIYPTPLPSPPTLSSELGIKGINNVHEDDTIIKPTGKFKSKYENYTSPNQSRYPKNLIHINSADQQEWESLYNIGPFRAEKIINFRKALGGFYSVDQVGETYGVPDSVFQQIKPHLRMDSTVQKIDINEILYDSLYQHPYITKQMAYFMVKYREDVKPIETIDELYNLIKEKDHKRLQKLEPYLNFSIR